MSLVTFLLLTSGVCKMWRYANLCIKFTLDPKHGKHCVFVIAKIKMIHTFRLKGFHSQIKWVTHTYTQITPINTASIYQSVIVKPLIQFIVYRLKLLACIIFYGRPLYYFRCRCVTWPVWPSNLFVAVRIWICGHLRLYALMTMYT